MSSPRESAPGALLNLEDAAFNAYTKLLPHALNPEDDPVYGAPLAPIRREAWPDHAVGARLTIRPDTNKTVIAFEKGAFGLNYTAWALKYRGNPHREAGEGAVMDAEVQWPPARDGIAVRYRFEIGDVTVASKPFAGVGFRRPEVHEKFALLEHLGAAITNAAIEAPEEQQDFVAAVRRLTGHSQPRNYGGRIAGSALGLEIESVGALSLALRPALDYREK